MCWCATQAKTRHNIQGVPVPSAGKAAIDAGARVEEAEGPTHFRELTHPPLLITTFCIYIVQQNNLL